MELRSSRNEICVMTTRNRDTRASCSGFITINNRRIFGVLFNYSRLSKVRKDFAIIIQVHATIRNRSLTAIGHHHRTIYLQFLEFQLTFGATICVYEIVKDIRSHMFRICFRRVKRSATSRSKQHNCRLFCRRRQIEGAAYLRFKEENIFSPQHLGDGLLHIHSRAAIKLHDHKPIIKNRVAFVRQFLIAIIEVNPHAIVILHVAISNFSRIGFIHL